MKLKGRKALVTGASRGIGRGIALAFAAEGADVAVNYRRNAEEAEKTVAAIQAFGGDAFSIQADVADYTAVQSMVDGGVPMPMASQMVGHGSEKTTQAHYYKLSVDRRRVIGEGIPV